DTIVRYIDSHYRIGADQYVAADADRAEQLRARADIDIVADGRRALVLDPPQADDDAVTDTAVVAELRVAADNNAAEMIDDEIMPDLGLAGQLDPGDNLHELEEHVINERVELAQQHRPHCVSPAAETVHHHRPESLGAPSAVVSTQVLSDIVKHRHGVF